jgi:hypothetical protein
MSFRRDFGIFDRERVFAGYGAAFDVSFGILSKTDILIFLLHRGIGDAWITRVGLQMPVLPVSFPMKISETRGLSTLATSVI